MNDVSIVGVLGAGDDEEDFAQALQQAFERRKTRDGGPPNTTEPMVRFVTLKQLAPPHSKDATKPSIN